MVQGKEQGSEHLGRSRPSRKKVCAAPQLDEEKSCLKGADLVQMPVTSESHVTVKVLSNQVLGLESH